MIITVLFPNSNIFIALLNKAVSFVNKDKKMVTVVYGKGKEGFFKYDRFIKKLNAGDGIKIRMQEVSADGFMKVFSARVSGAPVASDYCKSVTGSVSSNMSMVFTIYHAI